MGIAAGRLLASRKFLLLCLDTVISVLVFFVGKYATPATATDIGFLIATLQPVFVAIIIAISIEDAGQGFGASTMAAKLEIAKIEASALISAASVTAKPSLATAELIAEVPKTNTEKGCKCT